MKTFPKKHFIEETVEDIVVDFFTDEFLPESRRHKTLDRIFLWARNISVLLAFCLFILQLFLHSEAMKAAAYFLGAVAYFFEIFSSTDCFRLRVPHGEMFMTYLFGPMYILLGISYLT